MLTTTWYPLGAVFVAAALTAFFAVPQMRRLAVRTATLDRNGMPLLGGAVVAAATLVGSVAGSMWFGAPWPSVLLISALLLFTLGLIDDRVELGAAAKLAVQLLVAGGALAATGLSRELVAAVPSPPPLVWTAALLWLVGITNAVNLLDNMDGLAAGFGAIAAVFGCLLAVHQELPDTAVIATALAGACLGFLRLNFPQASIYLGDSGSLCIGFLLAFLTLQLFVSAPPNRQLLAPLVLGLAIFDTTLVIWSRLRRNLNPLTTPGRDHLSHRLVLLGFSPRASVLLLWSLAAATGTLSLTLLHATGQQVQYVLVAALAAAGLTLTWFDRRAVRTRLHSAR